jgi:hypothetical protein
VGSDEVDILKERPKTQPSGYSVTCSLSAWLDSHKPGSIVIIDNIGAPNAVVPPQFWSDR